MTKERRQLDDRVSFQDMSKRKSKDKSKLVSSEKKSKPNGFLYCGAPGDEPMMKQYAEDFYRFIEDEASNKLAIVLLEKLGKCIDTLEALDMVESSLGFPFYNKRIVEFSAAGGATSLTNVVLMCPSKLDYGLDNDTLTAKIVKPFIEASNSIILLT